MWRLKLLYERKSLYNTLLFHVILCSCHMLFRKWASRWVTHYFSDKNFKSEDNSKPMNSVQFTENRCEITIDNWM